MPSHRTEPKEIVRYATERASLTNSRAPTQLFNAHMAVSSILAPLVHTAMANVWFRVAKLPVYGAAHATLPTGLSEAVCSCGSRTGTLQQLLQKHCIMLVCTGIVLQQQTAPGSNVRLSSDADVPIALLTGDCTVRRGVRPHSYQLGTSLL